MQIVTISRQLGSLGDVIAALVARKLGYKLIGSDQVHERANACDPEYQEACSVYDSEMGPGFFDRIFFDSPTYTSLFESLTYEFASEGSVVMMGRGSQFILKDVPGVLRVRVVAPTTLRVARVSERLGISHEDAAEMIEKYDRRRRSLLQSMFKHDMKDWALYDMVLNTTHYDADGASDVVVTAANRLQMPPQPEDIKERFAAMAHAKRLETIIRKRLASSTAYQVQVTGEPGGHITLAGRIRDTKNKAKAEQIAREFPGVVSVKNELKVTDLSFGF